MSLNFSSHKTHGHKRSSQLKETKKKTDISHPNTLIKLGKKKIDCLKNKNFVQDSYYVWYSNINTPIPIPLPKSHAREM